MPEFLHYFMRFYIETQCKSRVTQEQDCHLPCLKNFNKPEMGQRIGNRVPSDKTIVKLF